MATTTTLIEGIDAELRATLAIAKDAADKRDWGTWAECYDDVDVLLLRRHAALTGVPA